MHYGIWAFFLTKVFLKYYNWNYFLLLFFTLWICLNLPFDFIWNAYVRLYCANMCGVKKVFIYLLMSSQYTKHHLLTTLPVLKWQRYHKLLLDGNSFGICVPHNFIFSYSCIYYSVSSITGYWTFGACSKRRP